MAFPQNSSPLPFTGERFTPERFGEIAYEHWHRYAVLPAVVAGKCVLDLACGEGYGSAFLAQSASLVVGADLDPLAIQHARNRYATPNLEFVCASCAALPFASASFDCVVSFETIEHLAEPLQEAMLGEFLRLLKPDGVFIISSPNRPVYSEELGTANEFHVKELDRQELAMLIARFFPQVDWYAQRIVLSSTLWLEFPAGPQLGRQAEALGGSRVEDSVKDRAGEPLSPETSSGRFFSPNQQGVASQQELSPPTYFLLVCGTRQTALPHLPPLSLFTETDQKTLKHYQEAVVRAAEAEHQVGVTYLQGQEKIETLSLALDQANRLVAELQLLIGGQPPAIEQTVRQLRQERDELLQKITYRESWQGWLRYPFYRLWQLFTT